MLKHSFSMIDHLHCDFTESMRQEVYCFLLFFIIIIIIFFFFFFFFLNRDFPVYLMAPSQHLVGPSMLQCMCQKNPHKGYTPCLYQDNKAKE